MMDSMAFMAGAIIGSLVAGALIGLVPLICGIVKGRIGLALGGFAACIIGSFILGLFLSIPMCILFTILIFVLKKNPPAQNSSASAGQPGASAGAAPQPDSVRKCAKCGNILSPGQAFCTQCGAAAGAAETANRCPSCGNENPAGMAFCSKCGTRLR